MNKRIRELAEEARDWGYAEHSGYTAQLLFEQKFAELIVKECVKVAMRSVGDDEPKEAWYLIQEHFGVKE